MYALQFNQEPEQVTLTNQCYHTRKQGGDDAEIEKTQKAVAAEKMKKPFRPSKRERQ